MSKLQVPRDMTADLLVRIMPECEEVAEHFITHIRSAFIDYGISTVDRVAFFLAEAGHESVRFTVLSETMNYSVKGLLRVLPQYFTAEQAVEYAHQPKKIANRIYAGRNGNGDELSGDGWRFRGRGLFPTYLIGQTMYRRCSQGIFGNPFRLVAEPWILSTPSGAVESACWTWRDIGGNDYADEGTEQSFKKLTRKINKGQHGMQDRLALLARARKYVSCSPSATTA
jgi:putative chitinase